MQRGLVTIALAAIVAAGVAGCSGDGDDQSAVCDARDDLQASVADLTDVDPDADERVVRQLEDNVNAVVDDLDTLAADAWDAVADEASAVRDSAEQLDSAVSDLGDDPSRERLTAVIDRVSQLGDDVAALVDAARSECS